MTAAPLFANEPGTLGSAEGDRVPARCLQGDDVCELEPGSLEAEARNALGVAAIIAGLSILLFGMLAYRAARGGVTGS